MASFTALNVEPSEDVEVEVDNSKEIQVEEALKLYQNALKLHAQGPASYEEAEDAYDTLFASEIFSYPESQSEAKRLAKLKDVDETEFEDHEDIEVALPPAGADSAPNTLPQLLYLSYKNHGQFLVDRIAHHVTLEKQSNPDFVFERDKDAREAAQESLDFFVEALDKDETDADLWRRTARVTRLLGSRRILRFCLEAALQRDDLSETFAGSDSSLEAAFARTDLSALLDETQDELSLQQLRYALHAGRKLNPWLTNIMDPFPKLPKPTTEKLPDVGPPPKPVNIQISERSWQSAGKAILARKKIEERDRAKPKRTGYQVHLPSKLQGPIEETELRSPQKLVAAGSLVKKREEGEEAMHKGDEIEGNSVDTAEVPRKNEAADVEPANGPAESKEADERAAEAARLEEENVVLSPLEEKPGDQDHASTIGQEKRPSLKRNSESAGMNDGADGGRSRSKRLRARAETSVTVEEDTNPRELSKHVEQQLDLYAKVDKEVFRIFEAVVEPVGVQNTYSLELLQQMFPRESLARDPAAAKAAPLLLTDFRDILTTWNSNSSNLLLHGRGSGASVTLIGTADDSGLASFLEHSKPVSKNASADQLVLIDEGLGEVIDVMNNEQHDLDQIAMYWLMGLLIPHYSSSWQQARYKSAVWPASLKEAVLSMIVEEDGNLTNLLQTLISDIERPSSVESSHELEDTKRVVMELVQSLFELHLDVYGQMTSASSTVDQPTRTLQRDRTQRWAALTTRAVRAYVDMDSPDAENRSLALRHVWSTVMYVSLTESSSREHVLLCLRDLRQTLEAQDAPVITLPNSGIMPEISIEAAGREITRLTTMDFFLGVFDPTTEDPVTTIESLEPILMETARKADETDEVGTPIHQNDSKEAGDDLSIRIDESTLTQPPMSRSQQLSDFLGKASASLRLSLWHRLRTAYEAIDYPAMVVLCNFRSMQIILRELKSTKHVKEAKEDRTANLLVWVRNLSDLLSHSLDITRTANNSLECLDEQHLPLALRICVEMTDLLHIFVLWEDSVRVGQYQAPQQAAGGANSYKSAMNHLRELQAKCYMLLYMLLKEAMSQHQDVFTAANEVLAEYLVAVHIAFGHREYCRVGKKAFLKLVKKELLALGTPEDLSVDLAQVVFDLYGIKIYAKTSQLIDHGCNADQIDRTSALELIEPLMAQVKDMNIKDVLRSEIKAATEKMQAVIGTPRSSTTNSAHQAFNRRLLLNYLKIPIVPMDLFQCLKGIGGLDVMPVTTDYAAIAKKKWFFFQGHLLLARYLAQKKSIPGNTEDLDNAIGYFKLDLDFDAESWETWYRLAQTYDAKIDEDMTWDSRELNNPASELVSYQKSAIHCYAMAVAVAVRTADDVPVTTTKISELFTDFGNRVYASSRPPLDMKVFDLGDTRRFFNENMRGTWQQKPFTEMSEMSAWRFAGELYTQGLDKNPKSWWTWYMLGKCRWKLFKHDVLRRSGYQPDKSTWKNWYMMPKSEWSSDENGSAMQNPYEPAIEAFMKAIENIPRGKNKHGDRDPVLEPHYKLVSVTYKLMQLGLVDLAKGAETIANSPLAKKAAREESDDVRSYTLRAMKVLCAADKSNWHHRMVVRTAQVHYDADPLSRDNAMAAKRELNQQIFTKTMTIQVWRPEHERPGRHFVYKTNYTHFFAHLLHQLGDKADLDQLCKRIRRKQAEFLNHTWIWSEVATAYVRLLRAQGEIPADNADTVFRANMSYEAFALNAGRLEAWAHSQLSLGDKTLDLLREVVELRKLNGSYTPPTKIDELVDDTYARIYEQVVPGLAAKADEQENRERMRIDRMLMNDSPAPEEKSSTEQGGAGPGGATSSRAKRIGRGEMRRRAEALVSKLTTQPERVRGGRRVPQSPVMARGGFPPPKQEDGDDEDDGDKAAGSSAPGSVHQDDEDADDESELSEPPADEDEEDAGSGAEGESTAHLKVPMFPGLARREGTAESNVEGTEDEQYETAEEAVGGDDEEGDEAKQEGQQAVQEGDSVAVEEIAEQKESVQSVEADTDVKMKDGP